MPQEKLKVLNLFGGPGIGKSGTRGSLFGCMKGNHLEVEEAMEYAKELTWEERFKDLGNQLKILSEQYDRQRKLVGKVEWVVAESPLLLSLIYRNPHTPKSLEPLALELWNEFENINIVLERSTAPYNPNGRNQTEKEALKIDEQIITMLHYLRIPYHSVQVGPLVIQEIVKHIALLEMIKK